MGLPARYTVDERIHLRRTGVKAERARRRLAAVDMRSRRKREMTLAQAEQAERQHAEAEARIEAQAEEFNARIRLLSDYKRARGVEVIPRDELDRLLPPVPRKTYKPRKRRQPAQPGVGWVIDVTYRELPAEQLQLKGPEPCPPKPSPAACAG